MKERFALTEQRRIENRDRFCDIRGYDARPGFSMGAEVGLPRFSTMCLARKVENSCGDLDKHSMVKRGKQTVGTHVRVPRGTLSPP